MTRRLTHPRGRHLLGSLGLFLMLLIARLAGWAVDAQQAPRAGMAGVLARRGIDSIAAVGWLLDRGIGRDRRLPPAAFEANRVPRCSSGS